jgi:hypothetical protein
MKKTEAKKILNKICEKYSIFEIRRDKFLRVFSVTDRFRVNYGRAIALYRALMKMIKRNIMTPNEVYSWTLSCPIFKPFNTSRKRWSKFMFDATRVFQKNN